MVRRLPITPRQRSAEWHSAVSRIVNPQAWENLGSIGKDQALPNTIQQDSVLSICAASRGRFHLHLVCALLWLATVAKTLGAPFLSIADYPSIHEAVAQNPGGRLYVPLGRYGLTSAVVPSVDVTELEGSALWRNRIPRRRTSKSGPSACALPRLAPSTPLLLPS
jgi:hypothetical protein